MAEITTFNIGQGETFRVLATLENVDTGGYFDISGYAVTGQVRENYTTDAITANFTITTVGPLTSGSFYIELTPANTSAFTQRKYVYDIIMTSGSVPPVVRRLVEGYFVVRPASTR